MLNDRHRFRSFFRNIPSYQFTAASLAQLMREFHWRKMAIITQEETLFTGVSITTCTMLISAITHYLIVIVQLLYIMALTIFPISDN